MRFVVKRLIVVLREYIATLASFETGVKYL
jgi:hypothetical protein